LEFGLRDERRIVNILRGCALRLHFGFVPARRRCSSTFFIFLCAMMTFAISMVLFGLLLCACRIATAARVRCGTTAQRAFKSFRIVQIVSPLRDGTGRASRRSRRMLWAGRELFIALASACESDGQCITVAVECIKFIGAQAVLWPCLAPIEPCLSRFGANLKFAAGIASAVS